MTAESANPNAKVKDLKRCPVFKIDLKGRFVNVDDLTEKLLGLPAENLFGRSIKDFLDKDSYKALLEIIQKGSRFDTRFESINLNIKDADKKEHEHTGIVSLNFIAGNPANYQMVLTDSIITAGEDKTGESFNEIIRALFEFYSRPERRENWQELTDILCRVESVMQSGIYRLERDNLVLLAETRTNAEESNTVDFGSVDETVLTAVNEKHQLITDLPDNNSVDCVYPLVINNQCWGALRFVVSRDDSALQDFLMKLAAYIGNNYIINAELNEDTSSDVSHSNKDNLGILESLDCTIIALTESGSVVEESSCYRDEDKELTECKDVSELLSGIWKNSFFGIADDNRIEFALSPDKSISVPVYGFIKSDENIRLVKVIRAAEDFGEQVKYMVLYFPETLSVPVPEKNDQILHLLLEISRIHLDPVEKYTRKLSGQLYPQLNRESRFYIDSIQDNILFLRKAVNRAGKIEEILNREDDIAEIDLNEILTAVSDDFTGDKSGPKISIRFKDLPIIRVEKEKITELFRSILAVLCEKGYQNNRIVIAVRSEEHDRHSSIIFSLNYSQNEANKDDLENLPIMPDNKEDKPTVCYGLELPVAHRLARSLGGALNVNEDEEQGISIEISIPVNRI